MILIRLIFWLYLPLFFINNFTAKDKLVIKGELKNMKTSVPFIYIYYLDGTYTGVDSAKVTDGKYQFEHEVKTSSLITLYDKNPNVIENFKDIHAFPFMSEPTTIFIKTFDSLENSTISGSKSYVEFKKLDDERKKLAQPLTQFYNILAKENRQNIKDTSTSQKIDSIKGLMVNLYFTYIRNNPSSPIITYAISQYFSASPRGLVNKDKLNTINTLYSNLPKEEKASFYGEQIGKKLNSFLISIGDTAPSLVLNDTSGNSVSLDSFKGKYVLLDFWASWCPPCREENPNLVSAYKKYKDENFTILSVSLDRSNDKEKWEKAITSDHMEWTNVSDLKFWDNTAAKLYKIDAIPQNFLIDPKGKIIDKGLRGDNLEKRLSELFNKRNHP